MSWTEENESEDNRARPYQPTQAEILEYHRTMEENLFHLPYVDFIKMGNAMCTKCLVGFGAGISETFHDCGSNMVWLRTDKLGDLWIVGCYFCHMPSAFYSNN